MPFSSFKTTCVHIFLDMPIWTSVSWQPWLVYFFGALTEQKSRLEKKIARERILLGRLPELSVQILELCGERGHATISDIAKATGASRNTIKDHVTALVNKAHLVRHGAGRGTWYVLS